MIIRKEFDKHKSRDWDDEGYIYIVKYICDRNYIFLNSKFIKDKDTAFINIFNLIDKDFLEEHNIDYLVDKNNKTIPVGIVNFINHNENEEKYNSMYLKLVCYDEDKLYKCNEIIECIDKAIKLKYEAVKFSEKIGTVEQIELI